MSQTTIKESFAKGVKYGATSKQAKELNHAVAYFIAKDMMPFQVVEKSGFLNLMRKAAPLYNVPSRVYFSSKEIPKMYSEVRATVEKKVSDGVWFSATTDLWTSSSGGGEPYISFTVHYLSSDWQLMSHCLETMYFPEDHTHAHISEMIENMLQAWNIQKENVVCFTTDNASNMRKAFEEGPHPWVWLSCFGHNLNLAISKALGIQRVQTAVRACRHLVEGFSRSWKKKRELKKKQEDLELPDHALIHDVVTRWGSTFSMVSRFLEQQQAVCAVLAEDRSSWHLMPKDTTITILEDLSQLLSPLHDFTDALASEKRVTMSALKPIMEHITTEILLDGDEDSDLTKQMKLAMRDDLKTRYSEKTKRIMDICCFLDPRFKGSFSANVEDTKRACTEEAIKLVPPTAAPPGEASPLEAATARPASSEERASKKTLSGILKHITTTRARQDDNTESGFMPAHSPEQKLRIEMNLYMSMPPIDADADPLDWWKSNHLQLPLLANVAKKLFCIPATSVPSERAFSTSGHILSPQRSRLSVEKVNMLSFLHNNLT